MIADDYAAIARRPAEIAGPSVAMPACGRCADRGWTAAWLGGWRYWRTCDGCANAHKRPRPGDPPDS